MEIYIFNIHLQIIFIKQQQPISRPTARYGSSLRREF